jgi:hypothetical protein
MARAVEGSPQFYARLAGALYLALIALGAFGEVVRGRIVVAGDAATMAANLVSMESMWRMGIVAEFLALLCATVLAMIYFFLLRPVGKELNLLATFLRIVAITVQGVAVMNLVSALFPLGSAAYLGAFTDDQRHALMSLAIRAHAQGYGLALLFFGACFLAHGRLIFQSGFLPRALGVMIQVAGLCYIMNSLAQFLAPALQDRIFPAILLPCLVAELSLGLWLLAKGVDVEKWKQVNGEAARRGATALQG